ncbi:MAG: N-acetyltransferase family protein [Actinobacteria bacterium]|nr:MAG: N-acetyltransferase family protein [Actinomycetota bacterium]
MNREASDADLPAIVEIFNQLLATTTIEWTDEAHTVDGRRQWLHEHRERGDPVLVATDDAAQVVGVAAYGDFRDAKKWPGYRFTVEHSIHVRQDCWGRGVGRSLLEALVAQARLAGKHVMVGAIDEDNVGSIEFHRRLGFVEVARMPEIGFKHDRWLGLVLVQRTL